MEAADRSMSWCGGVGWRGPNRRPGLEQCAHRDDTTPGGPAARSASRAACFAMRNGRRQRSDRRKCLISSRSDMDDAARVTRSTGNGKSTSVLRYEIDWRVAGAVGGLSGLTTLALELLWYFHNHISYSAGRIRLPRGTFVGRFRRATFDSSPITRHVRYKRRKAMTRLTRQCSSDIWRRLQRLVTRNQRAPHTHATRPRSVV